MYRYYFVRLIIFTALARGTLASIWKVTRTARVAVRNNTPRTLLNVTVLHKYSDLYKDRLHWDKIPPGVLSSGQLVSYNTGVLTTGADWWLITWYNRDRDRFNFSNPNNFRRFLDFFEAAAVRLFDWRALLNVESTTGFKRHILRKEDAGGVTTITIENAGKMEIHSKSGTSSTGYSSTPIAVRDNAQPRPFYAIAHRVLTIQAVRHALDHGANAIETDLTAWSHGWWADHDGLPFSRGDKAKDLFDMIAHERRANKSVAFVWLDLKNPDQCGTESELCNIESLINLARNSLEPVGVKVLWGFSSSDVDKRAFNVIRDNLNRNEAIGIDGLGGGTVDDAKAVFDKGAFIEVRQRVWTKGLFWPHIMFGSCEDDDIGKGRQICSQIRQGVESKAFGKVFAWTIGQHNVQEANKLLFAGVDGLIYGPPMSDYSNTEQTKAAIRIITDWIGANPDKCYLATGRDEPW
ncbi:hypothetical protein O9K51_03649 [Purpureocillium lavendulum]|uniref:Up-regulated in Daf-2 domain-containing protein n=1 Tax=Purpureocillium lavendulum TaxID=1247861 RepID=A0AB34FUB9_9HYPO|nr:hypothetical protein O9K51_03649 [Purpureocillium lavendulum]